MSNKYLFSIKFVSNHFSFCAKNKWDSYLIKFIKISNFTAVKGWITNNDEISKSFFNE